MNAVPPASRRPLRTRVMLAALGGAGLLLAAALSVHHAADRSLERQMLATAPDQVPLHPALVALAQQQGPGLYAAHCATCHGATLQGNPATGAPNLVDGVHLFGTGRVFDVERTILYGIRAGGRARNVAEMPAFGATGLLAPTQIHDVVAYLRHLNGAPTDPSQSADGSAVYQGKGGCGECHGANAEGNSDYGAPRLTAGVFNNGGTAPQLYDSIYYGRHDVCPAFRTVLTPLQIRMLATYVFLASKPRA